MIKKIAVLLLFITLLLNIPLRVKAEDSVNSEGETKENIIYVLPYPGMLPNHPLYFLKKGRDKVLLFFNTDPVKRSQLYLLFSDKHLMMGKTLYENDNFDLAIETLTQGEKYLISSAVSLIRVKNSENLPPGVVDKLELAARKHEDVLGDLVTNQKDEKKLERSMRVINITQQAIGQIASLK